MNIKSLIFYLPLVLLVFYFGYTQFENRDIKTISTSELAQKLNEQDSGNIVFVDVREVSEYETGHIEGMKNMPLSTLESNFSSLPKDAEIILFCRSGNRSLKAANLLKDHGYPNVVSVNGGIQEWQGEVVTN